MIHNKKLKRIIVFGVTYMLFLSLSITAKAYILNGYKLSNTSCKYSYPSYESVKLKSFSDAAATTWNNANVDVKLSYGSGVCSFTEVYESGVTWDGITNVSANGNIITKADIQINSYFTNT